MMEVQSNDKWEEMFQRALEYRFDNGNWSVPISYPADPELGRWVAEQRVVRKEVMCGIIQTPIAAWKQRQEKLTQVGFDWDVPIQPTASQNDSLNSAPGSCRPASPVAETANHMFHLPANTGTVPFLPANTGTVPFFHQQYKNSSFFSTATDSANHFQSQEAQRLMGVENALARLNSKYKTPTLPQASFKTSSNVPHVCSDDSSSCSSSTEEVSGDECRSSQSPKSRKVVKPKGKFADKMSMLPEDFVPADGDVICGKGKKFFNHSGNQNFRQMVANKVQEYSTTSKLQRSFIVSEIVAAVCNGKNGSKSTGFVKKDSSSGRWFQLGDASARLKTTYAFWDALQELEQQQKDSSSDTVQESTKTPEKTTAQASSSVQTSKSSQELPPDFQPSQHDVIIENGNKNYNHSGNKFFRSLIADKVEAYSGTRSKVEKSFIVSSIVAEVRAKSAASTSGCGGFVKKTPEGRWMEIGDFLAREKTSQALRNAVGSYRSSSTTKKKRRMESQNNCLTSGQCDEINERLKPSKMPRTGANFPGGLGHFLSVRP